MGTSSAMHVVVVSAAAERSFDYTLLSQLLPTYPHNDAALPAGCRSLACALGGFGSVGMLQERAEAHLTLHKPGRCGRLPSAG